MTPSTPPQPANDSASEDDPAMAAFTAAQRDLEALSTSKTHGDEFLSPIYRTLHSTLKGFAALYFAMLAWERRQSLRAEQQRSQIMTFADAERKRFSQDLAKSHAVALEQLKAEEAAHNAQLKAGLFDTMKGTFTALFREERRESLYRAMTTSALAGIAMFSVGVYCGYLVRGANATNAAASEIAAVASIAQSTKENAEAIRLIGESILHMKPDEFNAISQWRDVVAQASPVPGDQVPAPCVAAVPEGTLAVNGVTVSACVVVLKHGIEIHGGTWLINTLAARGPTQQIQPVQ